MAKQNTIPSAAVALARLAAARRRRTARPELGIKVHHQPVQRVGGLAPNSLLSLRMTKKTDAPGRED